MADTPENPPGDDTLAKDTKMDLDELQNDDANLPSMAEAMQEQAMQEQAIGTSDVPTDRELGAVYDIPVQVSAVLGKATMQVNQLLKLGRGAVVELDRKVGETIDVYVNNRLVARGEVVVVEDRLGITMTEIIKSNRG